VAERRSDKHGPRIDEEMRHEVASLIEGSPVESRSREQRLQEDPDPYASTGPGLEDQGEIDQRAELARSLRPSSFPATKEQLLEIAVNEQAPDEHLDLLRRLPDGVVFEHFEDVWEALGGHTEHRRPYGD
jgi:hypothetical protein